VVPTIIKEEYFLGIPLQTSLLDQVSGIPQVLKVV